MSERESYQFMWGQKQSALIAETHILNFIQYNKVFSLTKGINDVIRQHKNGDLFIYWLEESIKNSTKNGAAFLNPKKTTQIFNRITKMVSDFRKFLFKIRALNFNKLTSSELYRLVEKYKWHHIFMQKLFRASEPSGTTVLENEVLRILSTRFGEAEKLNHFTTLLTPTKLDETQQELVDWYSLLNSPSVEEKGLLKHAFKYPSNYANVWSYEKIIKYLKERAEKEDLNKLKEKIKEIKNLKKTVKKKQQGLYRNLKNKKLKYYCDTLQKLSLTRFDLKHAWSGAETLALPFLEHLARRVGLDISTFMASYNYYDLENFLLKGHKLSSEEIKERRNYSIIHLKGSKLRYLYGKEAEKYFNNLYQIKTDNITEFRGVIAAPGNVQGRVKIVKVDDLSRFINDHNSFVKGEILVTTMTSPLMLPIAAKAAAIVTNEGGLLSHAAVIARELRIPCIVGTKIATEMLKNGDFIEVDAEKGIVRKLSH